MVFSNAFKFTFGVSMDDKVHDANGDSRWVSPETHTVSSFTDYIDILEDFSHTARDPWEKDGICLLPVGMPKQHATTPWTGAFLLNGKSRRRITDVIGMAALFIADKDDGNLSLIDLRARLPDTPCCIHTTTKSRHANQRWRIILECDREHTEDEFDSIFRFIADRLNGLDETTHHSNRIQYVPSQWTSADNVFARYDIGTPLCVDDIVAAYPPIPKPLPIPPVALSHAPSYVTVITNDMVSQEIGNPPGGRMFRIMCAAAARFKRHGWALNDMQLANAAMSVNVLLSPSDPRNGIVREAQRAIDWANAYVGTISPIPTNYFYLMMKDH